MEIKVERQWFSETTTIGKAFFDGEFVCFTLEPTVRAAGVKVPKKTAIPAGRYEAYIRYSIKHERRVIGLKDVPNFDDIEWHVGNFAEDTEGCTLVGQNRLKDCVGNSLSVYGIVFAKAQGAILRGEPVFVTYENLPAADSPLLPPMDAAKAVSA